MHAQRASAKNKIKGKHILTHIALTHTHPDTRTHTLQHRAQPFKKSVYHNLAHAKGKESLLVRTCTVWPIFFCSSYAGIVVIFF